MLSDRVIEAIEAGFRVLKFLVTGVRAADSHAWALVPEAGIAQQDALVNCPKQPQGNPKLSVIILTLEAASLLERLLQSFERHNTWRNLEILVVNHGRDIQTQQCLEAWSHRLPIQEIKLLNNYSFAYSCNRAAEISTGDQLLFLNNDVEFEEDILPRMSAAIEHHAGLSGIKLFHCADEDGGRGAHHHIGVRFRWNIKQCWMPPYNAVPQQGDEFYEQNPTRMPAVTAAFLGCNRAEFLQLGGFHEGYVYAYEDVDLCLKYRLGLGAETLSLNDISALHGEGATRMKNVPSTRRQVWHAFNSRVFRGRFGALARRDYYQGFFGGDRVAWGRTPVVAVVDGDGRVHSSLMADLLGRLAWAVCHHAASFSGYNLFGVDALVCANPAYRIDRARHRPPGMIAVAYVVEQDKRWTRELFDEFDLLIAPNDDLTFWVREVTGRPVHGLLLDEEGAGGTLFSLIRNFTGQKNKVSIKAVGHDTAPYMALKSMFEARGDKVRIDVPKDWRCRQCVRDDVVMWAAPPDGRGIQEGSVNIALFTSPKLDEVEFDGVLEMSEELGAAEREALLSVLDQAVSRRLDVPSDPPLVDRSKIAYKDLADVWRERPDPVRSLLDM